MREPLKFKVEIDRKIIETEIQFLNCQNLRELFLQRGSITDEDKWEFYMMTGNIEPDIKVDKMFMFDLNLPIYPPRFFSVANTILGG